MTVKNSLATNEIPDCHIYLLLYILAKAVVDDKATTTRTVTLFGQTYYLEQFHFHHGNAANKGSEHTVDGKQYESCLKARSQNKTLTEMLAPQIPGRGSLRPRQQQVLHHR